LSGVVALRALIKDLCLPIQTFEVACCCAKKRNDFLPRCGPFSPFSIKEPSSPSIPIAEKLGSLERDIRLYFRGDGTEGGGQGGGGFEDGRDLTDGAGAMGLIERSGGTREINGSQA